MHFFVLESSPRFERWSMHAWSGGRPSRCWPRYGHDHDLRYDSTNRQKSTSFGHLPGLPGQRRTDGMTVLSALKMKASAEFEVQEYLRTVWSYENMQIIKNKTLWAVWWTVCFKIRGFQIFKIDFCVFFKCLTTKYLQNVFKYRRYLRLTKGTFSLIPVSYINMKKN